MRRLKALIGVAALLGGSASTAARETTCPAMLNRAPESVLRLEAVRSCGGPQAACGYVEPAADYGVLTLICSPQGVVQVVGANRLRSLRMRNGTLLGECTTGTWRRDAGLPGCYKAYAR